MVRFLSSCSCILAELLAKKPIFPGRSEIDQLELIYKLCGTPNDENWPGAKELSWWSTLKPARVFKRALYTCLKGRVSVCGHVGNVVTYP